MVTTKDYSKMATITASPPGASPQLTGKNKSPSLPPLMTNSQQRRTSSNRPSSFAQHRMSSYSNSKANSTQSRPISQVYPAFHSSLSYTLVRDFAYPSNHPLHYGPQPEASGTATPASESRRLSDPVIASWEDSRSNWSASPPWVSDNGYSAKDQLPAMTFNDGGPPYSEDEDLQSPVVTTSKKKHKLERGRSPGAAGPNRGIILNANGESIGEYRPIGTDDLDGPGGEIETYTRIREPRHRDSNFAKPIQRNLVPRDHRDPQSDDEQSEDEGRYSKDYSFTIASPDEEMHGKAVALFDFVPEHENELALSEGQIILVSYRHGQGWLVAEDLQTRESGLVPEEFVRLVRHIEGGLNGLNAMSLDERIEDVVSPISNDPSSAGTPRPPSNEFGGHTPKPSNGSNFGEKHPAVQSNFSTSSRDFSPLKKDSERENS